MSVSRRSHRGPAACSATTEHEGMFRMRTTLQRMLAIGAMATFAGIGAAMMVAWSPASVGLISPASAQEDDDGGDDDDDGDDDDGGGQVPAGGVATGQGGTATPTGDDDDGD